MTSMSQRSNVAKGLNSGSHVAILGSESLTNIGRVTASRAEDYVSDPLARGWSLRN